MVKKEKKSKSAEQKARVAAKQTRKSAQKEKKARSKAADGSDAEDVDLESVLEEYARQQAQYVKVTEASCEPPGPRSSATIIGSPNRRELFLFGGEYFNGNVAEFYNDLYVYHIDRDNWRKVTSPNSPLPRSGHAWCRGGNAGGIYLFGGEFSSPKQGTFYHYNDFWWLEPSSREWNKLESKGKRPPARSGHRMTYFKNYIILFGGFQDTSQSTKYLQDLWIYDCQSLTWHSPALPPACQKPDARSSFSLLPHVAGAVIYGGYSRTKASVAVGRLGNGVHPTRAVLKPTVHQDTWFLRITQPPTDAAVGTPPQVRWERRKRPANLPNPARAGTTMAHHKGRGIIFGGVHDVEESEEGIDSEFFNELYVWNIERNRFYPLNLRKPKPAPKGAVDHRATSKRYRARADEVDLLHNLASLSPTNAKLEPEVGETNEDSEHEAIDCRPRKSVLMTMPHPRFNAQLAVYDDTLFIFGGTYERGDAEYTFDEMWAIDLVKLAGVTEIYRRELQNWLGDKAEWSDSEDEHEESEDEHEASGPEGVSPPDGEIQEQLNVEAHVMEDIQAQADPTDIDTRPQPRPFETLRDFFTRTCNTWQEIVLECLQHDNFGHRSSKELRKDAFDLADNKWWECREEITALEDEQATANISEVINIADRGDAASSPGRRR